MTGVVHVEYVMGTAVTVDLRGADDLRGSAAAVVAAVDILHEADRILSPWRPGSDVNRLRAGLIAPGEGHPWTEEVDERCRRARELTRGWFDPWRMRDGYDPTGLVKGWAAQRASAELTARGFGDHAVNAGGDVCVRGAADPAGAPGWRIGVVDPHDRTRILDTVTVHGGAVATSGGYERGSLAVDPRSGEVVTTLASATVVGPDLGLADALATAASAAGPAALDWLAAVADYDALLVTVDGDTLVTPGWTRRAAPIGSGSRWHSAS